MLAQVRGLRHKCQEINNSIVQLISFENQTQNFYVYTRNSLNSGFQLNQLVKSFNVKDLRFKKSHLQQKVNWCLEMMVKKNYYKVNLISIILSYLKNRKEKKKPFNIDLKCKI